MDDMTNIAEWKRRNNNMTQKSKFILLIFAYLFWIVGAVFAAVGAWNISQKKGYASISKFATGPGIILTVLGCIIFFMSTFGVIGAARENLRNLRVYKICLIIILVFEVAAGIIGFAFWPEVKKVVDSKIQVAIEMYSDNSELKSMMDLVQRKFECCGSLSVDDWDSNPYYSCKFVESYRSCGVPWSCCLQKYERNRLCGLKLRRNRLYINLEDKIHTIGCLDKLFEFMKVNMHLIGGLAIACNVPLLISIVLAQRLMKQIKKIKVSFESVNEKPQMPGPSLETELSGMVL